MLSLIVAMDKNRLIGDHNRLPWHLPADLKHFKKTTMGKPIIMGRKTFESIGRPLPKRLNLVLTRNTSLNISGCRMLHQIDEVLEFKQQYNEIFVIGGAEIYQQLFLHIQRMYITQIHAEFKGDTYFITYDPNQWQEIERQNYNSDTKNPYPYSFITLERKIE